MSFGREHGTRICCAIQSAQLLSNHYSENEAKTLLSLFPNVISLSVQDSASREVLKDRYGDCLCSYTYTEAMQSPSQQVLTRPVISDADFEQIWHKGNAICSIPSLSPMPFFYHGFDPDLSP